MKTRIIPHQRNEAAWHLAVEEALFLKAKQQMQQGVEVQPIVRLYSFNKPSVILGYKQNISEVDAEYCREQNVHLTMRSTGGGSVFLGQKDLQYSLLFPQQHSNELLASINTGIKTALQDVGLHPALQIVDNHPILRMHQKSFVFDAQRRFASSQGSLLLHHGTTLMSNHDYDHMPAALKATQQELQSLQTGNQWLHNIQQLREQTVIQKYNHHLPHEDFEVRDLTYTERQLANQLYTMLYTNPLYYGSGKKQFGICYLPHTKYDMELYVR